MDNNESNQSMYTFVLLWIGLIFLLVFKKKVKKNLPLFRIPFNKNLKKENIFIISNHPSLNKFNDIVNFENLDMVYKFFREIDFSKELHIIILTEGGESEGADSIAYNLSHLKYNGYNHNVNIYIPAYAYSSGSMMMMAGDNIYMDWYSLASPVDSQLEYELDDNETFSVKFYRKMKTDGEYKNSIGNLIKKDAEAIYQTDLYYLKKILKKNPRKQTIINKMFHTKLSHGANYNINDLKNMGLNIITPIPEKFKIISEKLIANL